MRATVLLLAIGTLGPVATARAQAFSTTPPIQILGFADVDYLETDRDVDEGFFQGQLVGHLLAGLSERTTVVSEVSATARSDQYRFEVERLFLRYDFSDAIRISGGRYHTPTSYWNTAFHHGLWLQTTVGRPQMIRFGTELQPVHFVGILVDGSFPTSSLGFAYAAGIGNGRGDTIGRPGDAGDNDNHRAVLASATIRPAALRDLRLGAAAYVDRTEAQTEAEDGLRSDERILSAHAVWLGERPEVLAEYARIIHEPDGSGTSFDSDAYYVQVAYRLRGAGRDWKPYVRFEEIDVPEADPVFSPFDLDYQGFVAGLRFDFTTLAALKVEYRREEFETDESFDSLYVQASFAFGQTGGEIAPRSVTDGAR